MSLRHAHTNATLVAHLNHVTVGANPHDLCDRCGIIVRAKDYGTQWAYSCYACSNEWRVTKVTTLPANRPSIVCACGNIVFADMSADQLTFVHSCQFCGRKHEVMVSSVTGRFAA